MYVPKIPFGFVFIAHSEITGLHVVKKKVGLLVVCGTFVIIVGPACISLKPILCRLDTKVIS